MDTAGSARYPIPPHPSLSWAHL
ncbi:hypothetical protein Nmel_013297 [Mimus melanotis]